MKSTIALLLLVIPAISVSAQVADRIKELDKEHKRAISLHLNDESDSAADILFDVIGELNDVDSAYYLKTIVNIDQSWILGDIYQHDLAIESGKVGAKYANLIDSTRLEIIAFQNIARNYVDLWRLDTLVHTHKDSALFYLRLTEDLSVETNNILTLSGVYTSFYGFYMAQSDYLNAYEYSSKSAKLFFDQGNFKALANRFNGNGWTLYKMAITSSNDGEDQSLDSAIYFLKNSIKISDSLDLAYPKYDALWGLSKIYALKGQFDSAFYYGDQAVPVVLEQRDRETENTILQARAKYETAQAELREEKQRSVSEKERRRANIYLISGSSIILFTVSILIAVNQKRQKVVAQAAQKEQEQDQKINELINEQEIASLQGILEGQEKERKRVAMDLHDRLGGILSMAKLQFSSVEERIAVGQPEKEKFLTATELLDQATSEVRMISHDLLSGVLAKFGLVPALEDLASKINASGEIEMHLIVDHMNGSLDGEQELQVYRIVQELIGNTLKHAKASEINVQLNEYDESVNLMVEDDGIGFDPLNLRKEAGIGLENLKARVATLGGTLNIDSGKGAGTTISVDIPIIHD